MEKYIIQSYLFGFAAPGLCSRAEYRPTSLINRYTDILAHATL